MLCKNCASNIKSDFKFCPYCGERMVSDFQDQLEPLTPPFVIRGAREPAQDVEEPVQELLYMIDEKEELPSFHSEAKTAADAKPYFVYEPQTQAEAKTTPRQENPRQTFQTDQAPPKPVQQEVGLGSKLLLVFAMLALAAAVSIPGYYFLTGSGMLTRLF